jgi:predicted porin
LGLSEGGQQGRKYALTANYVAGPLHLGAAYEATRVNVPGVKPKEFGLRALYELGDFTVGAYYIRNDGTFGAGTKRNSYRGAVMYTMGPGELHLNLGVADEIKNNGINNDDARQWTIGYNYNLSKRTKAYTYYTSIKDDRAVYTGKFSSFALGVRHNF